MIGWGKHAAMPVTIDFEYLIGFLNELRAVGFDVSTQQYIDAQDLLIALAANGYLPEDPRSLCTLLGPIVCSTPREQENFYRYFDRWIKRNPQAARPATESTTIDEAPVKQRWTNSFRDPAFVAGSLILLVGLITGIVLLIPSRTLTLSGNVVDADNNRPLRGATISYLQRNVSSDGEGKFSVSYRKNELPVSVNIINTGYETERKDINAGTQSPLEVRLVPLPTPEANPAPAPVVKLSPTPTPFPTPITIELLALPTPTPVPTVRVRWTGYWIVILPLLVFGGWWLWTTRINRAFLRKLQRATEPRLDQLVVKGGVGQLFQGPSFRRTIQELRRHRQRGASELDAQRTVSRTVEQGGLFTPAYGSRQALPEYLVLIDRASFADQQARLDDEIVRRFVQDNVFVDAYHFRGDPRLCRKQDKNSPYLSLQELAALHPEHHLIIFSDGSTFINPLTGETERWAELFSSWTTRALLTPESPAQWGYRERALAELDLIVLPATKEGLAVLTELLGGGTRASVEADRRTRPYPSMLRDRTTRWLENHEPQPANLQRLCDQLKVFLGTKGYQWLSACAIYPILYWDLTLYLGFKLFRDRGQIEDRLLSLVRLPWFRYGSIPDWLRLRLISDLSAKDEASIRKALEELLRSVTQQPTGGIQLDIASDEKEAFGLRERWQRRFQNWRFWRWFWQVIKNEPPESPLRDYVFLSFMSGRKPRKLTVSLPDTIRKFIFPHGQPALGLRPLSLLTLAIVGSLALFVVNWRATKARTVDPPPSAPPFFYSLMSTEQRQAFIKEQAQLISARLGSGATITPESGLRKIKGFVDEYAQRVGNNSTQPDNEDLLTVFGRAVPLSPQIIRAFRERNLPPVLGLYTEMFDIVSKRRSYGDEFSSRALWALTCAKALGSDSAGMTLVIPCCDSGPNLLRLVSSSTLERDRNGWFLLDQQEQVNGLDYELFKKLPRFFAAAIVGENPARFRMNINPLSSYSQAEVTYDIGRISNLIAQFSGDNRRKASNELVQLYPQYGNSMVEALINAIVPQSPASYRVNLYIARTLGAIRPNWEGTPDQLARLQALRDTQDYRDPTFKARLDEAISGFIEIKAVVPPSPSPSPSPSPGPLRVQLNVSDLVLEANQPVRFTASIAPAVPGAQYRFSFGDGNSTPWQIDREVSYQYPGAGRFTASVAARVTSNGSMVQGASRVQLITVNSALIVIEADRDQITVGQTVNVVVQSRFTNQIAYRFSFGDGSDDAWQNRPQASHRYLSPGEFNVNVTLYFREGSPPLGSSSVRVVVSPADGELVTVPDVLGRSVEEAKKIFNAVGLNLRHDPSVMRDARLRGNRSLQLTITDQDPKPGTKVRMGTVVTVR
jgi:hypothetical protein